MERVALLTVEHAFRVSPDMLIRQSVRVELPPLEEYERDKPKVVRLPKAA